ncbi:MAG: hypothetical protein JRJ85_12040, partial [Deltaproteobacteria bacterium]|nr:hypothetical protein [Deltaproteobacteria bacterium]
VDVTDLPKPDDIENLLGKPHKQTKNIHTFLYEVNSTNIANIEVLYDSQKDQMMAMSLTFFRYKLDIDFEEKIARGRLKNWTDAFGLGFWVAFSP